MIQKRCPFGHPIYIVRPIAKEAYCHECGQRWETVACRDVGEESQ